MCDAGVRREEFGMKILKSRFTCLRDGLTIRGYEFRPEGERLPVVILSHGFMENHAGVEPFARQFAQMGYAAYVFDFNGGCLIGSSDGKTTEMSVLTEKEDLKAVISYVSALRYTDNSRLILMGCSQGGFVSALAAAEMPERVKKLILFYPAFCIPDDARAGKMLKARFDPQNVPETFSCMRMKLGRRYAADVMGMNAFEEIRGYRGAVLIVQGTADPIVNAAYAKQAWKTYTCGAKSEVVVKEAESKWGRFCPLPELPERTRPHRYVQLALIPGGGHGFTGKFAKKAWDAVERFVNGYAEILSIDLTSIVKEESGRGLRRTESYRLSGVAISPYYRGTVGEDSLAQVEVRGGKRADVRAELHLSGKDYTGAAGEITIFYERNGGGESLRIVTPSKALHYLQEKPCVLAAESTREGKIARIYLKAEM